MKRSIWIASLLFLAPAAFAAGSQKGVSPSAVGPDFLERISDLARQCVVQPYSFDANGKRAFLPLKSTCVELQGDSRAKKALIELGGIRYQAVIEESEDSDGGDLNDLSILDPSGRVVATRHNVAAFNNVFIALSGGDSEFPALTVR